MPLIDVVASLPHYWRHLSPIVDELRARSIDVRTFGTRSEQPWGERWRSSQSRGQLTIVASGNDARLVRGRPTVYLEHGAGQTYTAGEFGYAGARGLDHVVCFLAPGEPTAAIWRAAYPQAAVHSVGCAALDRYSRGAALHERQLRTVAITFHWECGVCPESRSAFTHYSAELPSIVQQLRRTGCEVIGHGHPRIWRRLEPLWRELGVDPVADWDDVIGRAGRLIADNTSALYEWAWLGRPVVVLNAPWYRRDVEHGLRFWTHVPGVQVDEPGDVLDAVWRADDIEFRALRSAAARHVYAPGRLAAVRAANAIMEAIGMARTREVASESRSKVDELTERLQALGATDDEVAEFRRSWIEDEWNPGEREQLIGMADAQLRASIVDVRDENDFHTQTPDEAAAIAADAERAAFLEALRLEAFGHQSTESVADVLAWVDDDLDRAVAVLGWEVESEQPRKTLVEPLSELVSAADVELDAEGAQSSTDAQSG